MAAFELHRQPASNTMSMRQMARPRIIILLSVALLVLGFWRLSSDWDNAQITYETDKTRLSGSSASYTPKTTKGSHSTSGWKWNADRDRSDHSLTLDQCHSAFPELYTEIDRSADYWRKFLNGKKIGPEHIDLGWSGDGGLQCMIYNQQLYITFSRGLNHFQHWKERSHGTLHQIHRAILASREPIPNIEFSIKINDRIEFTERMPKSENSTVWAFSRNMSDPITEQIWLVPDFNWWEYPRVMGSFADFQRQALELDRDGWNAKRDQLVWRGTTSFNAPLRQALINQSDSQPWSDVHKVDEDSTAGDAAKFRITMPDHCKYKYAVHTEGTTWSGRLKYLLSCHLVVVAHPLTWHTHLYHLLKHDGPNQNYVQVAGDFANLREQMEDLVANPKKGKIIADNAAATFRDKYGTPAAQTCYWRQLFHTWSKVAYEPDPYEGITGSDGKVHKQWRGMTYEQYMIWFCNVPDDSKPGDDCYHTYG
ncbi:kdel motif-containing protein 1 [Acrodontium crateriforme]|uniref:Kdel motif-containing protein 1 n=1 Tax=Acrodontium crateriforme TaxID=150365 RepID=A0AAQ3R9Z9_9PEZI|nr:kdel motif-containing protein 1 [Acrodontium crateriforme]